MPVLKEQYAGEQGGSAIVLDMADLAQQAEQIKASARREAARVLDEAVEEASRQAELIKAEAMEEGREAGRVVGLAEGRQQGREEALEQARAALSEVEKRWLEVSQRWEEDRRELMEGCEASILKLAWSLAEKIVHRVAAVDRELVLKQLGEALRHVMRPACVTVRVHPSDRPLVEETMPRLVARFAHLDSLTLEMDDSVGRGGCVVTYGEGRVDATIENQLQRLVDQVIRPASAVDAESDGPIRGE